ncbi:hypothetical protein K505DRAFT_340111 [Melanomma pulvis-pyrius CBS 109.77]|uniref:Rhodopsin domain-containing protein n=1 Tax=Melanomma pulvis-pyrius CBS 109.77 TaxID=1314802 RepID=A0A6A6X3K7_9PLEO|nr:hypothetical protein K505DRAFT_340111 [Melanomma pulvis-pyrius CBS 109.77]
MEKFVNCTIPELLDPNVCPGLAPPLGMVPMDPNAYTLHPYVIATTAVCTTLVFVGVVIRIFAKAYVLKKMQLEDYCLLFAACGFGAYMGVMNRAFEYNCGKHQWNVSIADVMVVVQVLYSPPMLAAKLALLLQIQRIFTVNVKNFTYWIVWVLIIANCISYTIFLFMFIFACVPREKIWNPMVPGRCLDLGPTMISSSALNLVSDVAILVVPLLSISSLQMPTRRKVAVSAIFATGTLPLTCPSAVVSSILRLIYTLHLIHSLDITYWATPAGMWSLAEFTSVILCGCFPTFPPFLNFLLGKNKQNTKYSYGSAPNSRQPVPPFSPSKNPAKSPYSWNDTMMEEDMGPYIPLDERTTVVGASNGEGAHNTSESSLRPGPQPRESVIYKTVEFETTSING